MDDSGRAGSRPIRTTVWLARHGQTQWAVDDQFNGLADTELTERGRAQARGLAARLSGRPLAAVYCSTLRRTVETASIVAEPHGLTPLPRAALCEVDYGAWDGMPRAAIVAQYPERYAAWAADPAAVAPPEGETGYAALSRSREALSEILADHPGQEVLIVAHKAINRLLLCDLLGLMPRHYRHRLGQQPCALNCVEWRDGEPMVTLLNDVTHCA
jgi:probable phosphoglycerate mutase